MAHSACGWNAGCAGKTVISLDNACYTWAPLRRSVWGVIQIDYLYLYLYGYMKWDRKFLLVHWETKGGADSTLECTRKRYSIPCLISLQNSVTHVMWPYVCGTKKFGTAGVLPSRVAEKQTSPHIRLVNEATQGWGRGRGRGQCLMYYMKPINIYHFRIITKKNHKTDIT